MYMLYNVGCILSIGLGAYTFITALIEDIKINLNAINEETKIEANRLQMIEHFSDYIEIHSRAKQLTTISSNLFTVKLIIFFISDWFTSYQQFIGQYFWIISRGAQLRLVAVC